MSFRSSRVVYFLSIFMLIGTSLPARAQTGLAIETPSCRFQPCPLPSGQNGAAYADYSFASGGVPPYTWAFLHSTLGACGVSITTVDVGGNYEGYLSGKAITGTCSATVRVEDSTTPTHLTATVRVQLTVNPSGVVYTLTSQQPYGVASYSSNTNSVSTKPLPADIMSHLYTGGVGGDAIAKCALNDCNPSQGDTPVPQPIGMLDIASPGNYDNADAVYYSALKDPYGKVVAATPSGNDTVVFRYPSAAQFPESNSTGAGNECQITVWDQSTGWVVGFYRSGSACGTGEFLPTPSGGCGTLSDPCMISTGDVSAAVNLFTDADYGYNGSGGTSTQSSDQFAPTAAMLRHAELMNGAAHHALIFTVDCISPGTLGGTNNNVFPVLLGGFLGKCGTAGYGTDNTSRPPAGALFFVDYTSSQLTTICSSVPAWQCTMLTTLATYGGYVGITGANGALLSMHGNEEIESSEAWKYSYPSSYLTTDPFWAWANSQKGFDGSLMLTNPAGCGSGSGTNPSTYRCDGAMLSNIVQFVTTGSTSTDLEGHACSTSPGCYPSGHFHMADPCIAKGYAGVTGGCF
jgi:hypothetical protein